MRRYGKPKGALEDCTEALCYRQALWGRNIATLVRSLEVERRKPSVIAVLAFASLETRLGRPPSHFKEHCQDHAHGHGKIEATVWSLAS